MRQSNPIAEIYDVILPYRREDETPAQTVQRLAAERDTYGVLSRKAAALMLDAQIIIADYQRSHQLEYGCEVDPCDNCTLAAAWLETSQRLLAVAPSPVAVFSTGEGWGGGSVPVETPPPIA